MSSATRPGGLTAIAMFNLLSGASRVFGAIILVATYYAGLSHHGPPPVRAHGAALVALPTATLALIAILNVASILLAGASGLGILKLSRFWGRWCGSAFALVELARVFLWAFGGPDAPGFGRGFTIVTIFETIYPIFLFLLLHTVFARDFDEPAPETTAAVEPPTAAESALLARPTRHSPARSTALLARQALRFSFRSGSGIIFLLFVVGFGMIISRAILLPVEMGGRMFQQLQGADEREDQLMGEFMKAIESVAVYFMVERRYDRDDPQYPAKKAEASAWARYLIRDRPGLLSAMVVITLLALPFLVTTGAFDQFSSDTQDRGLRYLLLRTERWSIYLGRFLGTLLLSVAAMILVVGLIATYIGLKMDLYTSQALFSWGARSALILSVLCIPYVALCTAISGATDSPFTSLTIVSLLVGVAPALILAAEAQWAPAGQLMYLLPWWSQFRLLHPDPAEVAKAAAACVGYGAAYLALGFRHFNARDL